MTRGQQPAIPWRLIAGMGDHLTHAYFLVLGLGLARRRRAAAAWWAMQNAVVMKAVADSERFFSERSG